MASFLTKVDKKFHVTKRNSTITIEVIAGLTIFMNMVYILAVSSGMYAAVGLDPKLSSIAIAFVTGVISLAMGFIANSPIALSTGMGLNAFAVFTVCIGMGYPYELVMVCTIIEGIIFMILTFTGVRSKLIVALPHNLKMFIGGGIGGFLVYIGAQNSHLIVNDDSTLTTFVNFRNDFSTQGICALLAVIGLLVIMVLTVLRVKAAIIIGIFATWILGMLCQALGIYVPDVEAGYYSLYPSFSLPHISSLGGMFLTSAGGDITGGMIINVIVITLTMFYSDFFDTVGTCMTCFEKIRSQMEEEFSELLKHGSKMKAHEMEEELLEITSEETTKRALAVDAGGTILGGFFKCTTITSFVESGAGIESGGRTGLTAIVTGILFLLAIFLAPIFGAVPGFATGPALIAVGISMLISAFKAIQWGAEKWHEILPGALCVLFTVLTYNIANGMAVGIVSYTLCSLLTRRGKEVSPLMYVLTILLIGKFALL